MKTTHENHSIVVRAVGVNFGYIAVVFDEAGGRVWSLQTPVATSTAARRAAEDYIDNLHCGGRYKNHVITVRRDGDTYVAAVERAKKTVRTLPHYSTAKEARLAAQAYINSLWFVIRRPGQTEWCRVDTYGKALRERERADRTCQPGHRIVAEERIA